MQLSRFAFAVGACACACAAQAQSTLSGRIYFRHTDLAVDTDPPAPYGLSLTGSLGASGDVLGSARVNETGGGWFATNTTIHKYHHARDPAPGLGEGIYYGPTGTGSGAWRAKNGRYAFSTGTIDASNAFGPSGAWLFDSRIGATSLVFRDGQVLADTGETIDADDGSFETTLANGRIDLDDAGRVYKEVKVGGVKALVKAENGVVTKIMSVGSAAPWVDATATVTEVGLDFATRSGKLICTVQNASSSGPGNGIVEIDGGTVRNLYRVGQPIAGIPAGVSGSIGLRKWIDDGRVLIRSVLSGPGVNGINNDALIVSSPLGAEVVAREGAPIPGMTGATFRGSFNSYSYGADNSVAFFTEYFMGSTQSALFWKNAFGTSRLAQRNMAMPGLVGSEVFDFLLDMTQPIDAGGTGLVFMGSVRDASTGIGVGSAIWHAIPGSAPTLIYRTGDLVNIEGLGLVAFRVNTLREINADNTLLVEGYLPDNTFTIATLRIPTISTSAPCVLAACLFARPRRRSVQRA